MKAHFILPAALLAALSALPAAQSNVIPGLDVQLGNMTDTFGGATSGLRHWGHQGAFPSGNNGWSIATTVCNKGTVQVQWQQAMDPDHPSIAFLVARDFNGRFEQISDYSYLKHGFFALSNTQCGGTCTTGGGSSLGLPNCSDTYSTGNNGDQFWLGPPQEIDPWLGIWDPICSQFDKGEPPVSPPQDCDGIRSLSTSMAQALNPIGHRINVLDQDLIVDGLFYYQGYYMVEGEAEGLRGDNLGSRRFSPTWNGSAWSVPSIAGDFQQGSILDRWNGATVTSSANGTDDGRVYVAVRVTGPTNGLYHYEYAIHQRDNAGGIESYSIDVCPDARILNVGTHAPEGVGVAPFSANVSAGNVTFSNLATPQPWNTVYNVWFDSDAAPISGDIVLGQANSGPSAPTFNVSTTVPGDLPNVYLGDGCPTGLPDLYATGTPAAATLGNATFGLESSGNQPSSLNVLWISILPGSTSLGGGCTQWFGGALGDASNWLWASTTSDGSGVASYALPIPNDPGLEGIDLIFQGAGANPGGPLFGSVDLTNGLEVRVGDNVATCP